MQSFNLGRPLPLFAVEVQAKPPDMLRPAAGQCPLEGDLASSHTRTGGARPVLCGRAVGILHAGLGYGLVSRARCEDAQGRALVVPARDKIPLTDKLDPTDTGVMRLQFRQIR